jgi:hypothetical protein
MHDFKQAISAGEIDDTYWLPVVQTRVRLMNKRTPAYTIGSYDRKITEAVHHVLSLL